MTWDMALCSSDGIRPASKTDFDKFQDLVDNNEGWVKQYNKHGVEVFTKSQEGTAIKMVKVLYSYLILNLYAEATHKRISILLKYK
jgi:hypothetical protein